MFKTTNELKIWAIDSWLKYRDGYYPAIVSMNSLAKEGYSKAEEYLIRRQVQLTKVGQTYFLNLTEHKTHPFVMSSAYGLLIKLSITKGITITWIEILKYCEKRYKELGLMR